MYFMNSELQETAEKHFGMDPQRGHVRGRVVDMDGNGLGHSRIWVRETGLSTRTDEKGNYALVNVLPAIYSLVAESEGYSPSTIVDIPVEKGDNPGYNFVMFPNYNRQRIGRRRGALAFN
jgi:protocatechuate 3,4-dioxygenase beta subunit